MILPWISRSDLLSRPVQGPFREGFATPLRSLGERLVRAWRIGLETPDHGGSRVR
jgi:hypothetical protein